MVRVRVDLGKTRRFHKLHIDSGYYIRSLVYDLLRMSNKKLSDVIHNTYTIKPFSVSNLNVKKFEIYGNTIVVKSDPYFYFSTINSKLLNVFLNTLFEMEVVRIVNEEFRVKNVELVGDDLGDGKYVYRTVTPVVILHKNEVLRLGNPLFISKFNDLINRRLEKYGGLLKYYDIDGVKRKVVKVKRDDGKTINVPAYLMRITFDCDKRCHEVIYNLGLGQFTTRGYGFVEIVK